MQHYYLVQRLMKLNQTFGNLKCHTFVLMSLILIKNVKLNVNEL